MKSEFLRVFEKSKMNMKQFGEYFEIPYRTVQNWKNGVYECPAYLLKLIDYKLEMEKCEMTKEKVFENLEKLVGSEFDYDEVICAFGDLEEEGESSVQIGSTHFSGYDYVAYIDAPGATEFYIKVEDDLITKVEMY